MKTTLTKTETKIAALISLGFIEKEIADKLFISHHTVHTHTRTIRRKLEARNIADITRIFILSLPKITDLFKIVLFVGIQLNLIFNVTDFNMMRARRSGRKTVRVERVLKNKDNA